MKTTFKLNQAADPWKTPGHIPIATKGRGQAYIGGAAYTVPKALKMVRESLKSQGRAFTEVCDTEGWITITAE